MFWTLTPAGRWLILSGLDPARYASSRGEVSEKQFFTFESQISDKERFRDADPFSVRCMSCEATFAFEGLLEDSVSCKRVVAPLCLDYDTARGSASPDDSEK